MMAEVLSSTAQKRSAPRSRRVLVLIAAIGIAPIVASYLAYYVWPRDAHVNYGELLVTQSAPSFEGIRSVVPAAHPGEEPRKWSEDGGRISGGGVQLRGADLIVGAPLGVLGCPSKRFRARLSQARAE